jgi:hypothetical protein
MDVRVMHEDNSGDYSTYSIALYEAWSEGADGLEFQRDLRDHSDPNAWTPPIFCIVNSKHQSVFGGVVAVTWRTSSLSIVFTEEAAASLGLSDTELTMNLLLPAEDRGVAKRALMRVFTFGDETLLPRLEGFE